MRGGEESLVRSVLGLGDGDAVVFEDEGWDSRVYLVKGGQAVFKFPRSAAVRGRYVQEVAVLRLLEDAHDAVGTPKVRWESPSLDYIGLEGIVGHQLGHVIDTLSDREKRHIGGSLGGFVRHLHTLALPNARVVTIEDEIDEFVRKYLAAGAALEDEFTAVERRELDHFFASTLPETLRELGSEPRVCHGDLGAYNIVLGDNGRVGVIDFGDVGMIDRSKDFMGLDDPVMLDAALAAYGGGEALRVKVAIRALALPALDLPFYLGKGNAAGVAICIDRLRRSLLT